MRAIRALRRGKKQSDLSWSRSGLSKGKHEGPKRCRMNLRQNSIGLDPAWMTVQGGMSLYRTLVKSNEMNDETHPFLYVPVSQCVCIFAL